MADDWLQNLLTDDAEQSDYLKTAPDGVSSAPPIAGDNPGPAPVEEEPSLKRSAIENFLLGSSEKVKDQLLWETDVITSGLQAALGGTMDDIAGLGNAAWDLASGKVPLGQFSENMTEHQRDAEGELELVNDRLGLPMELVANVLGGVHPGSVPGRIGKAFQSGRTPDTLFQRIKNVVRSAGAGGTDAAVYAAMEGAIADSESLEDFAFKMGMPAIAGVGGGAAGQMVLGEMIPMLFKHGLVNLSQMLPGGGTMSPSSADKIGDRLLDTGRGQVIVAQDLKDAAPLMIATGKSLPESMPVSKQGELIDRFTLAIAEAEGIQDKIRTGELQAKDLDRFAETMAKVSSIAGDAEKRINDDLAEAFTPRTSSYSRYKARKARSQHLTEQYEELTQTGPRLDEHGQPVLDSSGNPVMKLGAKPRNLGTLTDAMNNRVAAELGTSKAEISGEHLRLLDEVMLNARPKDVRHHARTVYTPQSGDPANLKPGEIDVGNTQTNVALLMHAYKSLGKYTKAGAMINGNSSDKETVRAALDVRKALSNEIAQVVGGANKRANKEFAALMREDESYEMGADFFTQGLREDPDFGRDLGEYKKMLSDTEWAAFQDGYRSEIHRDIMRNGPDAAMTNLFGDIRDSQSFLTYLKSNKGKVDDLKEIIGADSVNKLFSTLTDNRHIMQASDRLRQMLDRKGMSEAAINGIMRDGDPLLIYGGLTPGQNSMLANATIASVTRGMKKLGPNETELLERAFSETGKTGADTVREMLSLHSMSSSLPSAGVAGVGANVEALSGEAEDFVDVGLGDLGGKISLDFLND